MLGAIGLLAAAIAAEIGATSALPLAHGFRVPTWSAVVIAGYAVSIFLFSHDVHFGPLASYTGGPSGVGTAAIAAIGVVFRGEHLDWISTSALVLIIAGVVVINLRGAH